MEHGLWLKVLIPLCGVARYLEQIKMMRFGSGQGANHSDTHWYRSDLQRSHGPKGAFLCSR
jgi:hypothetical protein